MRIAIPVESTGAFGGSEHATLRCRAVYNAAPQNLQYVASSSWPSRPHAGHDCRECPRPRAAVSSEVTIPVGTAMIA